MTEGQYHSMNKKLYVGNLSYSTDDASLQAHFAAAGNVASARVLTDRETGRSRGFGFVEMATEEDAQKAIQSLNGIELDGRALTVNEAREQAPRGGGGGFGGRPGGGGGRDRRPPRDGGGYGGGRGRY
jgi:RNA recognition motif-containing protein